MASPVHCALVFAQIMSISPYQVSALVQLSTCNINMQLSVRHTDGYIILLGMLEHGAVQVLQKARLKDTRKFIAVSKNLIQFNNRKKQKGLKCKLI